MLTEALIGKLKHMQARLADIIVQWKYTEMSDNFAYTNGKNATFKRESGQVKQEIASFYKSHPLDFSNGDTRFGVESIDGSIFGFVMTDLSRPGVMKTIRYALTTEEMDNLRQYIGNETITYNGYQCDVGIAYQMLEQRFKAVVEECGKLRIENRELHTQLEIKHGGQP